MQGEAGRRFTMLRSSNKKDEINFEKQSSSQNVSPDNKSDKRRIRNTEGTSPQSIKSPQNLISPNQPRKRSDTSLKQNNVIAIDFDKAVDNEDEQSIISEEEEEDQDQGSEDQNNSDQNDQNDDNSNDYDEHED